MHTTARMMMTSAKLSPEMTAVTALTAAAHSKMIIMGSASCSSSLRHTGVFLPSASLLGPCCARRPAASASLRPPAALESACRASCSVCV